MHYALRATYFLKIVLKTLFAMIAKLTIDIGHGYVHIRYEMVGWYTDVMTLVKTITKAITQRE